MTYARARPTELVPWIEAHDVPLLENALHRWSDYTDQFKHMWQYETPHAIDAGGYNVMSRFVTRGGRLADDTSRDAVREHLDSDAPFYPWPVPAYHSWLSEYADEIEWATVMDYACGDQFDELWSVDDRIEATWQNTVELFDRRDDGSADYDILPVCQGQSVEEYVAFYERLEDHGLPTEHVGLGTLTRLSDERAVAEIERAVRDRIGADRIHGFGVKVEAFKNGAEFETADSQAWSHYPTNGRAVLDAGERLRRIEVSDSDLVRKIASFTHYYSYVTRLHQGEPAVDVDRSFADLDNDESVREQLTDHIQEHYGHRSD